MVNQGNHVKNLFVGNLPFTATEEQLREHFSPAGKVIKVRIMTDRDTGRPRGFAFVEMETAEQAEQAIRGLDQTVLGGRLLRVDQARPPREGR